MAQIMAHVELVPARQDDRLLHVNSSLLGLLSPQQTERPRLAGTSLRPHSKKRLVYTLIQVKTAKRTGGLFLYNKIILCVTFL